MELEAVARLVLRQVEGCDLDQLLLARGQTAERLGEGRGVE